MSRGAPRRLVPEEERRWERGGRERPGARIVVRAAPVSFSLHPLSLPTLTHPSPGWASARTPTPPRRTRAGIRSPPRPGRRGRGGSTRTRPAAAVAAGRAVRRAPLSPCRRVRPGWASPGSGWTRRARSRRRRRRRGGGVGWRGGALALCFLLLREERLRPGRRCPGDHSAFRSPRLSLATHVPPGTAGRSPARDLWRSLDPGPVPPPLGQRRQLPHRAVGDRRAKKKSLARFLSFSSWPTTTPGPPCASPPPSWRRPPASRPPAPPRWRPWPTWRSGTRARSGAARPRTPSWRAGRPRTRGTW